MIPTLHALLREAARLHSLSEADIRLGHDARCRQALGVYVYMASEATEQDAASIALYAGRSIVSCQDALVHVEGLIAADPRFAALVTEAMIEAMSLDEINARRFRRLPDLSAADIANRLLGGRAEAITLGTRHYSQIAAAYLAQAEEIAARDLEIARLRGQQVTTEVINDGALKAAKAVATAWRDYERDQYSPGVRFVRDRLERAVATLADIHSPIVKPSKEPAHV